MVVHVHAQPPGHFPAIWSLMGPGRLVAVKLVGLVGLVGIVWFDGLVRFVRLVGLVGFRCFHTWTPGVWSKNSAPVLSVLSRSDPTRTDPK